MPNPPKRDLAVARLEMKKFNTQAGWTFWSLLFVISVIVFVAYVGMQLVPVYSSNENVKNAMEQSLVDQSLRRVNRNTIIKGMKAQLFLDGNSKVIDYSTDLTIKRSLRKFEMRVEYNREIPLFYNLFVLVKFDNLIERELQGE